MKCYAVIDTNVIVSALLAKSETSATVLVVQQLLEGSVIPIYNDYILEEYSTVLRRKKFRLDDNIIDLFLQKIREDGICVNNEESNITLPDMKDVPFYVVALNSELENTFLVTGNIKHFPKEPFVVTPAEFLKILQEKFL